MMMTYRCCRFPWFPLCIRLHSHFSTRLKLLHALACTVVMVLFLIFFNLLQVLGDFMLIVIGRGK